MIFPVAPTPPIVPLCCIFKNQTSGVLSNSLDEEEDEDGGDGDRSPSVLAKEANSTPLIVRIPIVRRISSRSGFMPMNRASTM